MSYYNILGLNREPFSTSPDPGFLYKSKSHMSALHRIEIAVRLKRGMSLLLGDVGTGKTTIARALIQSFKNDPDFILHIVLDPYHENRTQFITNLCRIFGIEYVYADDPEAIERYLFQKCVLDGKTVVLIVDEGQKLSYPCLEVLRTLLNYETNEFKLLQLVIMAQLEFLETAGKVKNFMDRVSFKYVLNPLDEEETKDMINYRLLHAGMDKDSYIFTAGAIREIYNYTKGYPRKINNICHHALENAVMYGKSKIDELIAQDVIKHDIRVMQSVHSLNDVPPIKELAAG